MANGIEITRIVISTTIVLGRFRDVFIRLDVAIAVEVILSHVNTMRILTEVDRAGIVIPTVPIPNTLDATVRHIAILSIAATSLDVGHVIAAACRRTRVHRTSNAIIALGVVQANRLTLTLDTIEDCADTVRDAVRRNRAGLRDLQRSQTHTRRLAHIIFRSTVPIVTSRTRILGVLTTVGVIAEICGARIVVITIDESTRLAIAILAHSRGVALARRTLRSVAHRIRSAPSAGDTMRFGTRISIVVGALTVVGSELAPTMVTRVNRTRNVVVAIVVGRAIVFVFILISVTGIGIHLRIGRHAGVLLRGRRRLRELLLTSNKKGAKCKDDFFVSHGTPPIVPIHGNRLDVVCTNRWNLQRGTKGIDEIEIHVHD